MNKNASKIRSAIAGIGQQQPELISGTVVSGSVDTVACTVSVLPLNSNLPVANVRLGSITGTDGGLITLPADGSHVVIGSIDGPGEWTLLKASTVTAVTIKTGGMVLQIDSSGIVLQNGATVLQAGAAQFKMNSPGESMYQLLHDLVSYIVALTVPTPSGVSGLPVNIADFTALLPRIATLLTA
jgi:hypothetical protein